MSLIFATSITAFCLAFFTIKAFKPLAIQIGLVDRPDERKKHQGEIPLIGGISVFVAVLFASVIWLPNTQELRMYLIASAMMVFIGAIDDKYDISVRVRIVGQIIIASLLIYGVGGYISDFGNLFGLGNVDIGSLGIFFTYFAIVVLINAFNMVDGIDGLVGSLSINTFASMALLFLISGQTDYIAYPLIILTALLPYLAFNLGWFPNKTRKIFMGDAGSMFIGLSVIWLLVMGTQGDTASFRPVTALWICAIPLMDMLSIVIRRAKNGKSPFKPDRDHLHHILQRMGFSTKQSLVAISCVAALFSSAGLIGEYMQLPESIMLGMFLVMFVVYNVVLKHQSKKSPLG